MKRLMILLCLVLAFPVFAGGPHKHHNDTAPVSTITNIDNSVTNVTNNYPTTVLETTTERIVERFVDYEPQSLALPVAVGHATQFGFDTLDWQIGVGLAQHRGTKALGLGLGKREGSAVFSGSLGVEEKKTDEPVVGLGGIWRF